MHELRYFQEIVSLSEDLEALWLEKCECVINKKFRYPEALKIYYDGKYEWLFDYLPTKLQASCIVAESALPRFECAKMIKKEKAFL